MLIDTHVHLNIDEFKDRLDEVVKSARDNDVLSMVVVGIGGRTNERAIEIAKKYNLLASVGVHPSNAATHSFIDVLKYVEHEKVVAIGETGLDLYWPENQKTLPEQVVMFRKHIELAIKKKLPLIIHVRNSFNETYEILKEYQGKVSGVFHCFTLGLEEARKIIDLGFYLGLGGVLTFKNAKELQEAVKRVPIDKLILETDAPYLAPDPHRGKRNEPAYVKFVAIKLAQLLNLTYDEVAKITTNNAKRLFKLGDQNV
ncbi:MAG TPA: TatD family hydrolase [Acholeplasmataceae bacterium]|nr:TatD family hydrolase [Acholeplasmataceae bacterium]HQC31037.1 TatD family hydrolase [Acholeplasmataceae bacterium]